MNNNFNYTLSIGQKYEAYFESFLAHKGHQVVNHTQDKEWQAVDIDFEVSKGGATTTVEVKADSKINKSGNFFFEEGFQRTTGYYKGWFHKCQAAYIAFIDYIGGKGYILNFNKEVIRNNAVLRHWYNTTDNCYGDALLLNYNTAKQLGLIALEWTM